MLQDLPEQPDQQVPREGEPVPLVQLGPRVQQEQLDQQVLRGAVQPVLQALSVQRELRDLQVQDQQEQQEPKGPQALQVQQVLQEH